MQDNQITIVGNMVADPERRELGSGVVLTRFRVASTQRRLDRESGQWRDAAVTFLAVSCWRRLADHTAATLRKGDPVVVVGRLAGREWEREGQRRYSYELEASLVALDLNRVTADVHRRRSGTAFHGSGLAGGGLAGGGLDGTGLDGSGGMADGDPAATAPVLGEARDDTGEQCAADTSERAAATVAA